MSIKDQNTQGGNQQSQQSSGSTGQEKQDISLPRIDRPEGPFEHSGEVAGWTKEEKEEKQDLTGEEQKQGPGKQDQQ